MVAAGGEIGRGSDWETTYMQYIEITSKAPQLLEVYRKGKNGAPH